MEGRVSVVIPVFNGVPYLREAIASVLDQTRSVYEIIVIDDGSTDNSVSLASSFSSHVRCLEQSNAGTASARNRGVRAARGDLIAFLDQDDIWRPEKTERQLEALKADKDVGAVFGLVQQFMSPDTPHEVASSLAVPDRPQDGYGPSAMIIQRQAFLQVGFFEERWAHSEWIEWLLRLNERDIQTRMLPEIVAERRIHARNKGVLNRSGRSEYLRALKESLDRRRSRA